MNNTRVREKIILRNCRIHGMSENGSIFSVNCEKATVEVQSKEKTFRTKTGSEYVVYRKEYALITCSKLKPEISLESFDEVEYFKILIPMNLYGENKDYPIEGITPVRIDLDGDWVFKISDEEGEELYKKCKDAYQLL